MRATCTLALALAASGAAVAADKQENIVVSEFGMTGQVVGQVTYQAVKHKPSRTYETLLLTAVARADGVQMPPELEQAFASELEARLRKQKFKDVVVQQPSAAAPESRSGLELTMTITAFSPSRLEVEYTAKDRATGDTVLTGKGHRDLGKKLAKDVGALARLCAVPTKY